VTLLLGNKKVGKSAIAMELAVKVAQRDSEWLGFPLNQDETLGLLREQ
jgi:RecA-family ATPase